MVCLIFQCWIKTKKDEWHTHTWQDELTDNNNNNNNNKMKNENKQNIEMEYKFSIYFSLVFVLSSHSICGFVFFDSFCRFESKMMCAMRVSVTVRANELYLMIFRHFFLSYFCSDAFNKWESTLIFRCYDLWLHANVYVYFVRWLNYLNANEIKNGNNKDNVNWQSQNRMKCFFFLSCSRIDLIDWCGRIEEKEMENHATESTATATE